MKTIFIFLASAALAQSACLRVAAARIVAADLRDTVQLFGLLDPATPLGFAPLPGTQRILRARELALILQRYGIATDASSRMPDVCVERELRPIISADLKAALVAALGLADAEIDLIDFSGQWLPPGRLEFSRENLTRPPEAAPLTPVIWRGRLVYDERHSAAVWAKVRISAERAWFVAGENIPAGAVIRSDQVQTITGRQFPFWALPTPSSSSIVGKAARRNIVSGQRFAPGLVNEPEDIQRGDEVHVKLMDGQAWLSLDAVARSSGRKGDTILVHNPSSGRNFRAVVLEKGEVAVRPSRGA
jgi:flagella basal body P-ring formation protein FlgA